MSSPANILPALPISIIKAKPAKSTRELVSQMRGGTGNPPHAEATERLQDYIDSINAIQNQLVSYLQAASNNNFPAQTGLLLEIPIPHSVTTNVAPPSPPVLGQRLMIVLEVDSTGGGQITWDSTLLGTSVDDIDNLPNAKNFYEFVGLVDGNWHLCSHLLGGA